MSHSADSRSGILCVHFGVYSCISWELFNFFSKFNANVFCIILRLKKVQSMCPTAVTLGIFLLSFGGLFLFFLSVCFLMKFCTDDLDNSLMIIKLIKILWDLALCCRHFGIIWGYFKVCFSIYCDMFNISFMKFCTDILAITLMVKEDKWNIKPVFSPGGHFEVSLSPFSICSSMSSET